MKMGMMPKGMPLLKPEHCPVGFLHCWHGQRGAVDADKLKCCHCAVTTTREVWFNPSRTHGKFAPVRRVQEEA